MKQLLSYVVEIDDEITEISSLHDVLDEVVYSETGCTVIRSKMESDDEVSTIGEWEEKTSDINPNIIFNDFMKGAYR